MLRFNVLSIAALPLVAMAAPACVAPRAGNLVVAASRSDLADGHSAQWAIERTDGAGRVLLKPCSGRNGNHCWFAVDVEPGRYYFREIVPGPLNHMTYPVSGSDAWFEIAGQGTSYLGNWTIERSDARSRVKYTVTFDPDTLDAIRTLCRLGDRPVFPARIGQQAPAAP